ncbi:hypothetical protein BC830DRAFT_1231489 [Chytriomyces sp. MP71]|nr:hypothetical protein BC830DRAFT_1231489 [Chytriomyces sp. MP71]
MRPATRRLTAAALLVLTGTVTLAAPIDKRQIFIVEETIPIIEVQTIPIFLTGGNTVLTGGNTVLTGGNPVLTGGNTGLTGGNTVLTGGNTVLTGGSKVLTGGGTGATTLNTGITGVSGTIGTTGRIGTTGGITGGINKGTVGNTGAGNMINIPPVPVGGKTVGNTKVATVNATAKPIIPQVGGGAGGSQTPIATGGKTVKPAIPVAGESGAAKVGDGGAVAQGMNPNAAPIGGVNAPPAIYQNAISAVNAAPAIFTGEAAGASATPKAPKQAPNAAPIGQ